ncbi:NAD(P)-binding protein [Hypoxylon sp. EC38]|nr:NAD(P)-binding protein [Hypoxylon sp. EC38]
MAPPEEDTLSTVSLDTLTKTFGVNTFGPLLLTQALLPNLLKSGNPRLGVMSSRVGSIADNSTGGSYAYRASKAAVNSVFKSMAVDLKGNGVVVVIMHPGIVKTGLAPGSWEVKEAVMPEEAAGKLYTVLMSKGLEDTGRFWHREGYELEW